ncbi:hypothetical protein E2C01_065986 [Portunus trituberculatus]|uniref:Uncharacterized protein n=1 Tax=Portunus trituberculatus TaxID=210409 RepID=A0A5B7HG08_PORTR|nr:hypothetical protein [Portunus trituberculatus]
MSSFRGSQVRTTFHITSPQRSVSLIARHRRGSSTKLSHHHIYAGNQSTRHLSNEGLVTGITQRVPHSRHHNAPPKHLPSQRCITQHSSHTHTVALRYKTT